MNRNLNEALYRRGEDLLCSACVQVGDLGLQGWLQGPGQLQRDALIGVPFFLEASSLLFPPRAFCLACWGLLASSLLLESWPGLL